MVLHGPPAAAPSLKDIIGVEGLVRWSRVQFARVVLVLGRVPLRPGDKDSRRRITSAPRSSGPESAAYVSSP